MSVKEFQLIPIQEVAGCTTPKCKGEMVFTGEGSTSGLITTFKHRCDKCGEIKWFLTNYPRIVYKRKLTRRNAKK